MPQDPPFRVLIVKPSALGDVVQTVGVVRALAQRLPGVEIGWVVSRSFADLIRPLSCVTRVHVFERDAFRGWWGWWRGPQGMLRLGRELRAHEYTVALDFQGLLRSAVIARRSGAARRYGFARAREGAPLLYNRRIAVPPAAVHAIDRYLHLASVFYHNEFCHTEAGEPQNLALASTALESSEAEMAELAGLLSVKGIGPQDRLLVCCPGASAASKRWPAERFIELGQRVQASGLRVLLAGAAHERGLCAEIAGEVKGAVSVAGETRLRMLAALMRAASFAVCNDSGAMHIAWAQGCPLVALFGASIPERTGPYGRMEAVLRGAQVSDPSLYRHTRDDRFMRDIEVDAVYARVQRGIDASASRQT